MKNGRILWVVPVMDEWHVHEQDATRPEAMFDAREDAVDWACRVAQYRGPALVRVLDHAGSISGQYSFSRPERQPPRRAAA